MEMLSLQALRGWQLHTSGMNHCTTLYTLNVAACILDKHSDYRKLPFQCSEGIELIFYLQCFTRICPFCPAQSACKHSSASQADVPQIEQLIRHVTPETGNPRAISNTTGLKRARYFILICIESQK